MASTKSKHSARNGFSLHQLAAAAALAASPWGAAAQTMLDPVNVTAERRIENIKDVPSSISTLSGELLDTINAGGQDIRMLSNRVPSLSIESSFNRSFPRFYIRGLGNTDFDLNGSQPVSLVFDDVVQENSILKGFPVFDLERIEVLRGPQGTLFGRNSPAGVIKFESVKPGDQFGGYASLGLGKDSLLNLEGAVNVPLSPGLAARVSLQAQHRDDTIVNTYAPGPTRSLGGYDDVAARLQLQYKQGEKFSALANVHTRNLKGSAAAFRANLIKPGTNALADGFDESKVAYDAINEQDLSTTGASLRLRWDLGNGMALNSITGYESVDYFSRGDIDGGAPPYVFGSPTTNPQFDAESADGIPKHRQVTQEFRLESTGSGPMKWLAGLYYFDESLNIDSFNYSSITAGNPQNGYARQTQDNTAYALFGSFNFKLNPQLELRAGLRHTRDEKDFAAERTQSPFGAPPTGVLTANPSDRNTSGDLAATYAVDKNTNLYARLATGFRAPAIQGRLLFGDTLSVAKSEKVTSVEAGLKADLFERRARISAGVFSYSIKDQQLTAVGGQANFNQLVNAEKSVGRGVEVDLEALLTDHLRLTLGASYNDTQIKDPNLAIQGCGGGCTVLDPETAPGSGLYRLDGNALPMAPKTVLNFSLRYGMPTASGGEWYVLTDWVYRSKVSNLLYETVEFSFKPLLEGALRGGYVWGNGKYEAAAFVRNVANKVQAIYAIDFNNLTGITNEPRVFGVQFRASF